jgi:hypothetical protein
MNETGLRLFQMKEGSGSISSTLTLTLKLTLKTNPYTQNSHNTHMKTTLTYFFTGLLFLLAGCQLDEPLDKKVNDMDALPEITYEGKNILACKVNGQRFLSEPEFHVMGTLKPSFTIYQPNDTMLIVDATDFNNMYQSDIIMTSLYRKGQKEFDINFSYDFRKTSFDSGDLPFGHEYDQLLTSEPYYLKLLHLDDKIAVGVFGFSAVNAFGDTVRITEGRFDIGRD